MANESTSGIENTSPAQRLRYVVIGAGAGIMHAHVPALTLPTAEVVAIADVNVEKGQQQASEFHCPFYSDYKLMLAETHPDVAVVLTPPFLHEKIAVDCFEAGCHVIVEKPMAISIAEADRMIEAARRHKRLLCVTLQHRYRQEAIATKKLLQEGFLGQIQRVELTATWTRPASYFSMAAWRATWSGEGGGILTNQASHNLDLLCYFLGLPLHVVAWTRRLLHPTETEDTVHAMLEWSTGTLGSVHISTAEADDDERIKIVGTRGLLEISRGKLLVQELHPDMQTYAADNPNPYGKPERRPVEIPLPESEGNHLAIYRDFYHAILQGHTDYISGEQAAMELELANAMNYSSYHHCELTLPLDRQQYSTFLEDLQQKRKFIQ
jgi:predicted dehydrogenase